MYLTFGGGDFETWVSSFFETYPQHSVRRIGELAVKRPIINHIVRLCLSPSSGQYRSNRYPLRKPTGNFAKKSGALDRAMYVPLRGLPWLVLMSGNSVSVIPNLEYRSKTECENAYLLVPPRRHSSCSHTIVATIWPLL